jgi:hypothetical protein
MQWAYSMGDSIKGPKFVNNFDECVLGNGSLILVVWWERRQVKKRCTVSTARRGNKARAASNGETGNEPTKYSTFARRPSTLARWGNPISNMGAGTVAFCKEKKRDRCELETGTEADCYDIKQFPHHVQNKVYV